MIRQAISCDICGAEKKQTNHWFVACEQGGELRVSGWNSRNRLRAGSKHLCGQTCLHKLVDEFMARTIAAPVIAHSADLPDAEPARPAADTSLTSPTAHEDLERSARLVGSEPPNAALAAVVSMHARPATDTPVPAVTTASSAEAYSSRRWRAEAWERERSRELRAVELHPDILRRRKGF